MMKKVRRRRKRKKIKEKLRYDSITNYLP